MVYRKLHQNVATFRKYLNECGSAYPGGKEKLASKFIGRWRDGTPVELSPDQPAPSITQDPNRSTNFTYGGDLAKGIRLAIEKPEALLQDFNLSTRETTDVLTLARLISR